MQSKQKLNHNNVRSKQRFGAKIKKVCVYKVDESLTSLHKIHIGKSCISLQMNNLSFLNYYILYISLQNVINHNQSILQYVCIRPLICMYVCILHISDLPQTATGHRVRFEDNSFYITTMD